MGRDGASTYSVSTEIGTGTGIYEGSDERFGTCVGSATGVGIANGA